MSLLEMKGNVLPQSNKDDVLPWQHNSALRYAITSNSVDSVARHCNLQRVVAPVVAILRVAAMACYRP